VAARRPVLREHDSLVLGFGDAPVRHQAAGIELNLIPSTLSLGVPGLNFGMMTSATINSVVIWNRTDCCSDRLSDYWVFISNTPFSVTDTPATLRSRAATFSSHQTSAPNAFTTLPVGVSGR
jgi:hypothetical protein